MDKEATLPRSIGVILDGNRRWAKSAGIPTLEGHRAGYGRAKEFIRWAFDLGIPYLTLYAFSTENWKRETAEVGYLMDLLTWVLEHEIEEFNKEGARLLIIGERERLSPKIQELIRRTEARTASNTRGTVLLCISYGGRPEIINATRKLIKSGVTPENLSEEEFAKHLWTAGAPDPDMIIRTGGVMRLSNFLPWQSIYSELFFTETLWPDFTKEEFLKMLAEYAERERRFGK